MIIEEDAAELSDWQGFVAGSPKESRGFCPAETLGATSQKEEQK